MRARRPAHRDEVHRDATAGTTGAASRSGLLAPAVLAHSWQYARGEHLGIVGGVIRGFYAYGGTTELARRTAAGQGLSSFNHEQQADIAADAHAELSRSATDDRATYAPYVQELRAGAYK